MFTLPLPATSNTLASADESTQNSTEINTISIRADRLKKILTWGISHVKELAASASGQEQISHLYRNVLGRFNLYYERVTENENARSFPRTCDNVDVVYMP